MAIQFFPRARGLPTVHKIHIINDVGFLIVKLVQSFNVTIFHNQNTVCSGKTHHRTCQLLSMPHTSWDSAPAHRCREERVTSVAICTAVLQHLSGMWAFIRIRAIYGRAGQEEDSIHEQKKECSLNAHLPHSQAFQLCFTWWNYCQCNMVQYAHRKFCFILRTTSIDLSHI